MYSRLFAYLGPAWAGAPSGTGSLLPGRPGPARSKLAARPELDKALACLREGDVLVITRLSRAMRSLKHLLALADELRERGAGLVELIDRAEDVEGQPPGRRGRVDVLLQDVEPAEGRQRSARRTAAHPGWPAPRSPWRPQPGCC